jgi:hypothetical protein
MWCFERKQPSHKVSDSGLTDRHRRHYTGVPLRRHARKSASHRENQQSYRSFDNGTTLTGAVPVHELIQRMPYTGKLIGSQFLFKISVNQRLNNILFTRNIAQIFNDR